MKCDGLLDLSWMSWAIYILQEGIPLMTSNCSTVTGWRHTVFRSA